MNWQEEFEKNIRKQHSEEMLKSKDHVWHAMQINQSSSRLDWKSWLPWFLLLLSVSVGAYMMHRSYTDKNDTDRVIHELKEQMSQLEQRLYTKQKIDTVTKSQSIPLHIRDTIVIRDTVHHIAYADQPNTVKHIIDTIYRKVVEERIVEVPVIKYDTIYIETPLEQPPMVEASADREAYPDKIRIAISDNGSTVDRKVNISINHPLKN